MSLLIILNLFTLFFLSSSSHAKEPLRFDFVSTEQGLSQPTAFNMIQDKKGYIWIGTQNGLNRLKPW